MKIIIISKNMYDEYKRELHPYVIKRKCYPDRLIGFNVVLLPLPNNNKKRELEIKAKLRELSIDYEVCKVKKK